MHLFNKKILPCLALLFLISLSGCACDCKITDTSRSQAYLCDNNVIYTIEYQNRYKRSDEPIAIITIDKQAIPLTLSVKGFGKNYHAEAFVNEIFNNEPIKALHWQLVNTDATLTITTNSGKHIFQCSK